LSETDAGLSEVDGLARVVPHGRDVRDAVFVEIVDGEVVERIGQRLSDVLTGSAVAHELELRGGTVEIDPNSSQLSNAP
jgi:hypothetical protein